MVRKYTPSQLKSKLQQIENKRKQAIRTYNNEVNKYNREVKASVDKYNRVVKAFVNKYNQAVRKHNTNVQHNRRVINSELNKLKSTSAGLSQYHVQYRTSSLAMNNSYNDVVGVGDYLNGLSPQQERVYDLIEQEHANNLATANVILSDEEPETLSEQDIVIGNQLAVISKDLNDRWMGAVFSLNPANPDATRHFCTSAREIFNEVIEIKAPDSMVFTEKPECEKTKNGNATRREKIGYILRKKGLDATVEIFVNDDITNILELFHVLSDGTHGTAGKYSMAKLKMVKKRVEDGIAFLCNIAS
ncbi:MAG: hypothetical protein KGZ63_14765 [Clostridiales bacterium]|jgi:hypothetical protein|nr:hypothetical protein [Clostridiales bacterium]